jgi:hypothetical protein
MSVQHSAGLFVSHFLDPVDDRLNMGDVFFGDWFSQIIYLSENFESQWKFNYAFREDPKFTGSMSKDDHITTVFREDANELREIDRVLKFSQRIADFVFGS